MVSVLLKVTGSSSLGAVGSLSIVVREPCSVSFGTSLEAEVLSSLLKLSIYLISPYICRLPMSLPLVANM